jgi:hypothetical protein
MRRGAGSHERPNEGATNIWLTPPALLARLGAFDLDPCAAPEPRPWPTAARHYIESEDGRALPWVGRVWLNPPYGPQTGFWLGKLADHGDGIALVFARTETAWFQPIARRADAILFLAGRLFFLRPDGTRGKTNAGAPSCLLAFGARNVEALASSGLDGFFARAIAELRLVLA